MAPKISFPARLYLNHILQVSLLDWDGTSYVAYYNSFFVGSEESKYSLSLSGYDIVRSTLPDAFRSGGKSSVPFTTYDEDNDNLQPGNCASKFSGGMFIFFQ